MVKIFKRLFVLATLAVTLVVGALVVQMLSFTNSEVKLPREDTVFLIKSGSNIKTIAQNLTMREIIEDPWLFILLAKLKGVETRVRAGEYSIEAGQTPADLLQTFTEGSSIQYSFTVIEGWTFRQMLAALAQDPIIEHSIDDKTDAEIMALIGAPDQHPEGMFFPDTYRFPKGTSDIDFLRRAYQVMQKHLAR